MKRLRESFAAKLFVGLLGTVGVLLLVTYGVVRSETARQVRTTSDAAVQNAATQLARLEEARRAEVARVIDPFTTGPRAAALLEEALESGDWSYIGGEAYYQLELFRLDEDALLAFTDDRGRPVLALHGSQPMEGEDPLGIQPVAERVVAGEAFVLPSYRVLEGVLYSVRTELVQTLGGRAIGTLSVAVAAPEEGIAQVGSVVGVEVCVVVADTCVAGTARARADFAEPLVSMAGDAGSRDMEALGASWTVRSQPLLEGDPSQGHWVIAVPLDPVLAPFRRITGALLLSGLLSLVLAVLVGVALSRGLTRPVRALVEATGRVAEGDYEAEVPVTTHDELGTLAESFNDMTRGLLLKERLRLILDVVSSREVAEELVRGGLELGGENRKVTVLFADIRGFSALTEGMEPQEVIALLNECMQRLSDAVVEQGGHVDKFVGDELMAVFNAPKSLDDHVGRALRAALGMQSAMHALNTERAARGETPIGLGVGVNTGVVVAGKMGSQTRNNYTVLGDTVNLASRLCSAATAGEILVTRACLGEAGVEVRAQALGERAFKGFSTEMEVLSVTGIGDGRRGAPRGTGMGVALLLAGLLLPTAGASGQGLPRLRDLGGEYVSPGGRFQVTLSGQLDVEALSFSAPTFGLARGDGDFLLAPRLRVFADVFVGDALYGLLEVRADRGDAPTAGEWDARIEQAYVRVSGASGALSLQVGRFASPFGSYAARHLTPVDPFVRPPLFYDYRTMMCPGIAPATTTGFLTWRDRPAEFRDIGAPPVWGVPYQWGAMVAGSRGAVSYRVAAMNSAPSSDPAAWAWDGERMRHPSLVAGVGVTVTPSLSVGASYNRGPWLEELKRGAFPQGMGRWDYIQTLWAVDATYARGPVMARLEAVRDEWDVPNMSQAPVEWGGSLELQADLAAGFFAAARAGFLDFRPVDDRGAAVDWDWDTRRYEASLGYRLDRNAGLLASWGHTTERSSLEGAESLLSARFWWTF